MKNKINQLNIDSIANEELIHILKLRSFESHYTNELNTSDSDYHSTIQLSNSPTRISCDDSCCKTEYSHKR